MKTRNSAPQAARRVSISTLFFRPKLLLSGAVLAGLTWMAVVVWNQMHSSIARQPYYQVTAERLKINAPPEWVRSDLKSEVLQDAGLEGNLSVLEDPQRLRQRMMDAFVFHPWVASVERIEFEPDATIAVTLTYRRPLAAVEIIDGEQYALLVVDQHAVRLPEKDLTEAERRYLPRILGINHRPLIGETWNDSRTAGAIRLVASLADVWDACGLAEVLPSSFPEVRGEDRYFAYEILASGGTRILWGAAPGLEPAGESPFGEKRARLDAYVKEHGPLDTVQTPKVLDLRSSIRVEERTVKLPTTGEREKR